MKASEVSGWVCGVCHLQWQDEVQAEQCCVCVWDGCSTHSSEWFIYCDHHLKESEERSEREARERYEALPVVDEYEYLCLGDGDFFGETIECVREYIWDSFEDPDWDSFEVYPCVKKGLRIDLADYVTETIYSQCFELLDEQFWDEIPFVDELDALSKSFSDRVWWWEADTTRRVELGVSDV